MLASETGWTRDTILWDISLSEGLQYVHCALRKSGVWTVPLIDKRALFERTLAAIAAEDADELGDEF